MDKVIENLQRSIALTPLPIYEGECGFKLAKFEDPTAQSLLDKHLRRDLNQHAKEVLNIYNTVTFKQLQETRDAYLLSNFFRDPLMWLFMVKDRDFQTFIRESMGDKSVPEYVDILLLDLNERYREIVTYVFSF